MLRRIDWFLFSAVLVAGWSAAGQRETPKLVLAPGQRLEVSYGAAQSDSFTVDFKVAVPAAQKFQRHRCVISGKQKATLKTAPLQRWALRGDTLMVLSEVQLSLRAKADASQPLILEFDFVNLDGASRQTGTATLALSSGGNRAATSQSAVSSSRSVASSQPSVKSSVKPDSTAAFNAAAADSLSAQTPASASHSEDLEEDSEGGLGRLWVLIALILLGIALLALLSVNDRTKARAVSASPGMRLTPMAAPAINHNPGRTDFHEARAATIKADTVPVAPILAAAPAGSLAPVAEKRELAVPAAPAAIDLFADEPTAFVTPAGLQGALSKLREITATTQIALSMQSQALEQFSQHTASVRGFLLEQPAELERAAAGQEAPASPRNGHGHAAAETKPVETTLRVLPAEEKSGSMEEVASAIDGLVAATTTKPLAAPAIAISQKLTSLRRISSGLQELANFCRAHALSAPLTSAENLARRVLDLQVSCEAWLSDQSVKLSFSLPRASQSGAPARREIVDSIVDSLYETRKIAAQGPVYFERRVTQLLEYDLPRLRQQFQDFESAELRQVWEGMGL